MSEIGAIKYKFCKKLGDSHRDLAFYLGIPRKDRNRWEPGAECEEILEWLENRDRLHDLQEALVEIEREDLVSVIQETESSNPLNTFFEKPPVEMADQNLNEDDIVAFFQGYSDSWTPVQSGIALSRRLKQEGKDLLNAGDFVEQLLSSSNLKCVKIFGAGGSGKTTFSKMLAVELAGHQSSPIVLLRNLEQQQISTNEVQSLAQKLSEDDKKLFLIYDNPVRSHQVPEILTLISSLQNTSNIIVVVLEREDEWLAAYAQTRGRSQRGEQTYFLEEQLRSDEIEQLCKTIEKLQSELPNTHILSRDRDIDDFRQSLIQGNRRVLLVAMYEATTGEKIEETIINEFEGIPNEDAKRLYEFICGTTFYSIQFSYDLARVLYGTNQLKDIKRKHLAGIVHQRAGLLFARHKTIAEILWLKRNLDTETEMQTLAEFLIDLKHGSGYTVGVDLDKFSLQVFELLTTHPKLQPISLSYLSDIVNALSSVTEYRSTALLYSRAGKYFERQGETMQAITEYETGIRKAPCSDLFRMLGQALLKLGNSSKAIAILREGIQRAPNSEIYIALSQALLRQENGLDEAIAVLREAIERAPCPKVYTAISQALQLKSKNDGFEDTIAVLRKDFIRRRKLDKFCAIVSHDLKDIDLHLFVEKYSPEITELGRENELLAFARNLELHGHSELALNLLDQVKTQSADLLRLQGNCFLSLELWNQAMDYYLRAIEIAETNEIKAYIYNNLALTIRRSRNKLRYLEAIEYCNKAINNLNSFLHPCINIAFFRIEMSLTEDAESLLSELKKKYNLAEKTLLAILQDIDDKQKVEIWLRILDPLPKRKRRKRVRGRNPDTSSS